MPMSSRNSTAAASPTASTIGGVPASNLAGTGAVVNPSKVTCVDHVAAAEERRHRVEDLHPAPQHADAGRAAHLVAGERDEVGAPRLHVGDVVRDVLAGVDDGEGAGVVGPVAELLRPG